MTRFFLCILRAHLRFICPHVFPGIGLRRPAAGTTCAESPGAAHGAGAGGLAGLAWPEPGPAGSAAHGAPGAGGLAGWPEPGPAGAVCC